jgi:hypothetical protein
MPGKAKGKEHNPHPWSRHLSPDPDFTHPGSQIPDLGSRIPDPKQQKKRGVKKNLLSYLLWNFFIFDMLKKKNVAQFFKNYWSFYLKNFHLAPQKYGFGSRDPRSGIRKKPIPDPGSRMFILYPGSWFLPILDPGSRGQKGTGSRIRIRNTASKPGCVMLWGDCPPPPLPHPAS